MSRKIRLTDLDGIYKINEDVSYGNKGELRYYFHRNFPIFNHSIEDCNSFRMIVGLMVVMRLCRNVEIQKAFGLSKISICRWSKKIREKGPQIFSNNPRRRSATIMTENVLSKAQGLLNEGLSCSEIAKILGVKKDTLGKVIRAGKLNDVMKEPLKKGQRKPKRKLENIVGKRNSSINTVKRKIYL